MNNSILDVLQDVQLFKAQTRIPPGLRKTIPKGGVVLLFPRSSLRCFVVSLFRCVVVLSFYRWVAPPVDKEIYKNPSNICAKSIKIHPKWVQHLSQINKNLILYDLGGLGAQGRRKDENPGLKGFLSEPRFGAIC